MGTSPASPSPASPVGAGTGRDRKDRALQPGSPGSTRAQRHRLGAPCSFPSKTQRIVLGLVEERLAFLLNKGLKVVSIPTAPCVLEDILFLNYI